MEKQIEIEVRTTTQCSFVPFTVVPDAWKGMKVKLVLCDDGHREPKPRDGELPWPV